MATCATCGRKFSGFSFGAAPPANCPDCRRLQKSAAPAGSLPETPQFRVAVPKPPAAIVTNTIIGINVAVYLAMCVAGVSWIDPSSLDALRWGADFGPLTLGGEWWRLVASNFVHFGLVHIGFNMWCLYNLGRALETLMGRKAFAATYLASGAAGSIVSILVHPMVIGAGASGAIFGVAGTFAAYLFLKRIALTPQAMKRTRNSIAGFIVYNLIFGAAIGRIDNSAHVGGLIAGAILGAIVPPVFRFRVRRPIAAQFELPPDRAEQESHANRVAWGIIVGSAIVLGAFLFWVRSVRAPYAEYGEAVHFIQRGQPAQAAGVLRALDGSGAPMPLAPILLGEMFLDQGNPKDAVAPLQAAVASDSSDMQSAFNLALAYAGSGNPAGALDQIGKVIASDKGGPGWDALFIRAVAEGESGNYAQAIRDLQSVRQAKPDFKEAEAGLSRIEALAGGTPESQLSPVAIPCPQLVAKSSLWPVLP